ncbi:zinc-binding alcohol dehydrogenase family protein [Klenkia soli]|uniref:Zinc-type alcohol dehydrogenase-like protein n=1 Tax=Klenkia soli TaxID=1052260 RepID=A0A1H0QXU9_9ACTN|nr:zinc-binding alcohol dehydrogenase family protein [Klenkia soli]SDP22067.1 zinc-binding alcohol dehydrogenase family protein [Klenkia soli]
MTSTTAIASLRPGDADAPDSFATVQLDLPPLGPHDLLVDVRAVSVNPVDGKVRSSFDPDQAPKVLGFDASGTVTAVGGAVTRFAVGDDVFYAGSIARPGTNAQLHVVDERVVGPKPASLSHADAAALPLTTITAWETLFDRLGLGAGSTGTILVVGGAGGVGSMIAQLARARTQLTVVATGARPESVAWATRMGAHHVVDHHDLVAAVRAVAPDGVDHVFSAFSAGNVEAYAELLPVHGAVVAIDDPVGLDLMPLKSKAQTWHWEFMFARPLHLPEDSSQHELLAEVARLVDAGQLRTTATVRFDGITEENLREAHRLVDAGTVVGKVVLSRG